MVSISFNDYRLCVTGDAQLEPPCVVAGGVGGGGPNPTCSTIPGVPSAPQGISLLDAIAMTTHEGLKRDLKNILRAMQPPSLKAANHHLDDLFPPFVGARRVMGCDPTREPCIMPTTFATPGYYGSKLLQPLTVGCSPATTALTFCPMWTGVVYRFWVSNPIGTPLSASLHSRLYIHPGYGPVYSGSWGFEKVWMVKKSTCQQDAYGRLSFVVPNTYDLSAQSGYTGENLQYAWPINFASGVEGIWMPDTLQCQGLGSNEGGLKSPWQTWIMLDSEAIWGSPYPPAAVDECVWPF